MIFEVTYTRTITLTTMIEADSEVEADALARDEIAYLKDIDFEEVSTVYVIAPQANH